MEFLKDLVFGIIVTAVGWSVLALPTVFIVGAVGGDLPLLGKIATVGVLAAIQVVAGIIGILGTGFVWTLVLEGSHRQRP